MLLPYRLKDSDGLLVSPVARGVLLSLDSSNGGRKAGVVAPEALCRVCILR